MSYIDKEDYMEPVCVLCDNKEPKRIPVARIFEKFDGYLFKKEYAEAKKLLAYWVDEAKMSGDVMGELAVLNECVGLYRNLGEKENAFRFGDECLKLIEANGLKDSLTVATTYLNLGTMNKAFGKTQEAIDCYDKAETVYENTLKENDVRFAGLYNNKAVALLGVKEYDRAETLFYKAIDVLKKANGSLLEIGVTYTNLADLQEQKNGKKDNAKITEYMQKAKDCFNDESLKRDGEYAFYAEKCIDTFRYYGMTDFAEELERRARSFYERA